MRPSQTAEVREWLSQFPDTWRSDAVALVDAILMIGHDLLVDQLRHLVVERVGQGPGPVGLYVEREQRKFKGVPNRLFKESTGKRRRAFGAGPAPIKSTTTLDPQVGSEGIVASLVTGLCRQSAARYVSHPGPDHIRNKKIRTFVLITDFIGSGSRATNYLEAAWRVRSVKSWHSRKHLTFEVIAYSGTEAGIAKVRSHATKPNVSVVHICPTIDNAFEASRKARIKELCVRYDPVSHDAIESLGYGGTGALIAFAHGCPNNVPRLLHRRRKGTGWEPLFPGRVTSSIHKVFHSNDSLASKHLRELGSEGQQSRILWMGSAFIESQPLLAVLAGLAVGPRLDETLAARTGMSLPQVRSLVRIAAGYGWVGKHRQLTDAGRAQLFHANFERRPYGELLTPPTTLYYPKSLRAPGDN